VKPTTKGDPCCHRAVITRIDLRLLSTLIALLIATGCAKRVDITLPVASHAGEVTGELQYQEDSSSPPTATRVVFERQWGDVLSFTARHVERSTITLSLGLMTNTAATLGPLRVYHHRGLMKTLYEGNLAAVATGMGYTVKPLNNGFIEVSKNGELPAITVSVAELPSSTYYSPWLILTIVLLVALTVLLVEVRGPRPQVPLIRLLVYGCVFAAIAFKSLYYAHTLSFPHGPDEHCHVAYIAHLVESGDLHPDYKAFVYFNAWGERTETHCHLHHPPFYYHFMRLFAPDTVTGVLANVGNFRMTNLILSLAGIALFLWIGCRHDLPLWFHTAYAVTLASVPMLPYLATAVNNDNMGWLAGSLGMFGACLLLGDPIRRAGWAFLAFGLFLALAAKLTAAIHVGAFVFIVACVRIRRDGGFACLRPLGWPACMLICLIPMGYYLYTYFEFGTLLPARGPKYSPPEDFRHVSFLEYVRIFFFHITIFWTGILSQHSVLKEKWWEHIPLLLPIVLAIIALVYPRRVTPASAALLFDVGRCAVAATLVFLVFHLVKQYLGNVKGGYLWGQQPRYYFSLMPAALAASYFPFLRLMSNRAVAVVLAIMLVSIVIMGYFHAFPL
jgi:hypothetical protein